MTSANQKLDVEVSDQDDLLNENDTYMDGAQSEELMSKSLPDEISEMGQTRELRHTRELRQTCELGRTRELGPTASSCNSIHPVPFRIRQDNMNTNENDLISQSATHEVVHIESHLTQQRHLTQLHMSRLQSPRRSTTSASTDYIASLLKSLSSVSQSQSILENETLATSLRDTQQGSSFLDDDPNNTSNSIHTEDLDHLLNEQSATSSTSLGIDQTMMNEHCMSDVPPTELVVSQTENSFNNHRTNEFARMNSQPIDPSTRSLFESSNDQRFLNYVLTESQPNLIALNVPYVYPNFDNAAMTTVDQNSHADPNGTTGLPQTHLLHHLTNANEDISMILKSLISIDDKIIQKIDHSAKFTDDVYEYRFVSLPRGHPFLDLDLENGFRDRLMKENEWRELGIRQTRGWEHYGYSGHESNVFLFRRVLGTDPRTGKLPKCIFPKIEERAKFLDSMLSELTIYLQQSFNLTRGLTSFKCQESKKEEITNVDNNSNGSTRLITSVAAFGSSPNIGVVDPSVPLASDSLEGEGGMGTLWRKIVNKINARSLAAVVRSGVAHCQTTEPFLYVPIVHHNRPQYDQATKLDDVCMVGSPKQHESNGFHRPPNHQSLTREQLKERLINDIDWLYASIHMPLYAS